MEIDKSTKELLNKVNEITQKYYQKNRQENDYNVFEALKITTSEVKHSAFINDLLDINGKHGQKEKFLSIFIKTLKIKYDIKGFDEIQSIKTEPEKRFKDIDSIVDIIITSETPKQYIIIENKINAPDGENQLLKYSEKTKAEPNSYLFYLTLHGKFPSLKSTGYDKNKIEYKTISYKKDIVEWLKECRKVINQESYLYKTINHYIDLIRILIKQPTNIELAEDIINLVTNENNNEHFNAFLNLSDTIETGFTIEKKVLVQLKKEIFDELLYKFRIIIQDIAKKEKLECWVDLKQDKKYCNFGFYQKEWNYRLVFEFGGKNLTNLYYGFIDDGLGGEKFTKAQIIEFESQEGNNGKKIVYNKWHCRVLWQEWDNDTNSNYLKIHQAKDLRLLIESKVKNLHKLALTRYEI